MATKLNVHEAKTHLSKYLDRVEKGETIILCRRNKPIAEIRPLEAVKPKKRPIGLMKGLFTVPDSFFEPLPADIMKYFTGEENETSAGHVQLPVDDRGIKAPVRKGVGRLAAPRKRNLR